MAKTEVRTETKTDSGTTVENVGIPAVVAQAEPAVVPEAEPANIPQPDPETLKLLDATIAQIAAQGFDEQTQKRLNELFNTYDGIAGQEYLSRLYAMQQYGQPVILSKDRAGNTLLDNLEKMSKAENLHPTLRDSSPEIALNTVESILDPYTIYQGNKGTCVPSCMQFVMANEDPAEYSRTILQLSENLQAKVTHAEIKVTEEQVKQILEVDLTQDEGIKGVADKLIQTAILNQAIKSNERYDYKLDLVIDTTGNDQKGHKGVDNDRMTEALSTILTEDYASYVEAYQQFNNAGSAPSKDKIRDVIKMQVADGSYSIVSVDFDDLRNPNAEPDFMRHVVVVTNVEGDKVTYFDPARNPDVSEQASKVSPARVGNLKTFPVYDVYVTKSDASGLEQLDRE